ncbi:MAG: S8 family peptidase [Rubrobacter sp.]|nr:S8 family peptidase [Rubrobacter sp.]MDQ3638655.1 S8 family peptidase [Actinomycetota bacterium]
MIRRIGLLITVLGAMLLACTGVVLAQQTTGPDASQRTTPSSPPKTPTNKIPDQYIVVLKDDARDPTAVAREHAQRHGLEVLQTYRYAIKGYAARIPASRLDDVRAEEQVDYVEADQEVRAVAQTTPWGITKVGGDVSPTNSPVGGTSPTDPSSTVSAYIIDTGIDTNHADLKVAGHVNPSGAGGGNKDCNGHGTHVAGTVAAKDNAQDVVGSPSGVSLYGVKVLSCSGSGTWSGVIKGIDWVTANAKKPAVANMSLGGGASDAVDQAVKNSASKGIFYAVAAGNDNVDACTNSPARAGAGTDNGVMTVGATDKNDAKASFSNYGSCVDIWAPGVSILSTKKGGGMTTMSGTSMASPHGAGGGVLYLTKNVGASPSSVEGALKNAAQSTAPGKRLYVGTF